MNTKGISSCYLFCETRERQIAYDDKNEGDKNSQKQFAFFLMAFCKSTWKKVLKVGIRKYECWMQVALEICIDNRIR
jgi:hypothetical protein